MPSLRPPVQLGDSLASQGAKNEPVALGAGPVEPIDTVHVNEQRGSRKPEIQEWAEALAPRDHLGILAVAGERLERLLHGRRRRVVESGRLQPSVPISSTAMSWKGSTCSFPTSRIRSIES